jgi:RNase P/RNase MRP subunit POP5
MPGRALERELLRRLEMIGVHQPRFRIIRWEGRRGLVRVAHTDVKRAREAWNGESVSPDGYRLRLATVRSHGTLRKGKLWLRTREPAPTS